MRYLLLLSLLIPQYAPTGPHNSLVQPLNPCLVSAWPMNEGSGTTLHDTSGNSNTATFTGTPNWTSNPSLPGTTINWASGQFAVATSTTLTNFTGSTPFSVSVWANSGGGTYFGTLNASSGTFQGWELQNSGLVQDFFLINNYPGNAIDVRGTTTVSGGTHYLVATYDGSKTAAGVKLYADAAVDTPNVVLNVLSGATNNGLPVRFNNRNNASNNHTLPMAFAEVYNCVLTPTQISTYFASGPGIY